MGENFAITVEAEEDESAFQALLLIVGGLLFVVGILMLANAWVTKNSIHSIQDRAQLRALRSLRRSQNANQRGQRGGADQNGDLSSSSEDGSAVNSQEARVRQLN